MARDVHSRQWAESIVAVVREAVLVYPLGAVKNRAALRGCSARPMGAAALKSLQSSSCAVGNLAAATGGAGRG